MLIQVPLRRKDKEIRTERCNVIRTVELSLPQFESFKTHLLNHHPFLEENAGEMGRSSDGTTQAVMVLCEGSDDGILVDPEGSGYARYSAFVPGARSLLRLDRSPALRAFAADMDRLAERCAQQAVAEQQDGKYRFDLTAFGRNGDPKYFHKELFTEMLVERPEFADCETVGNTLLVTIAPELKQTEDLSGFRRLQAEQIENMCAKHVLWLNDAGGEQADFSGCLLQDADFSGCKLNSAVFDGARVMNCIFRNAELCFASMRDAVVTDSDLSGITAEEADLTHSRFRRTVLDRGTFTHSDFTGVVLQDSTLYDSSLMHCCIADMSFGDADLRSTDLRYASDDESTWLADCGPEQ